MSETVAQEAVTHEAGGASPFSVRSVLMLVVFGTAIFVALLWMIGAGLGTGSTNDGGAHAGGKGLNGYAAIAGYLEKRGFTVRRSQTEGALDDPGLLVLTPPHNADARELERIVDARRLVGPTLIVTPKWTSNPVSPETPNAQRGWVQLNGAGTPRWPGFLDEIGVSVSPMASGSWTAKALRGTLPAPRFVLSGSGARLIPLVEGTADGRILAAYLDDGADYPALRAMALEAAASPRGRGRLYPLVIVFEPDLLDNYGMAKLESALLAERLVHAAQGTDKTVIFDLTLNGHARSANLLTLAFTPPFLAATLCLLLAALAVGWRAFLRFGPPRKPVRAIAFGKRALVSNAAGLIRRTRRLHLIAPPYLARARERLAHALALPRLADSAATDAAIDRALAARAPGATPFSTIAARLAAARHPQDLVKAARDLHALERTLTK